MGMVVTWGLQQALIRSNFPACGKKRMGGGGGDGGDVGPGCIESVIWGVLFSWDPKLELNEALAAIRVWGDISLLDSVWCPPEPLYAQEAHPMGSPPCPSAPQAPSCQAECLHPMQAQAGDALAGIKEGFPALDGGVKAVGDGKVGRPPKPLFPMRK